MRQEKTVLVEETDGVKRDLKTSQIQKPSRKPVAPRFVSPITGMIVDQGENIAFEGIIDGECTSETLHFNCVKFICKNCAIPFLSIYL